MDTTTGTPTAQLIYPPAIPPFSMRFSHREAIRKSHQKMRWGCAMNVLMVLLQPAPRSTNAPAASGRRDPRVASQGPAQNGEGGIRTHGRLPFKRFRVVRFRPLSHLSKGPQAHGTLRIGQPRTACRDPLGPLAAQDEGHPGGLAPLSHTRSAPRPRSWVRSRPDGRKPSHTPSNRC
jgi:hypothetical protein